MTMEAQRLPASVLDHLRRLVGELAPRPGGPPSLDARLVEDLEYHSLALAELAIAIAEDFGLDVEDREAFGDLPEAGTMRDIESLVCRALARQGS